MPTIIDGPTLSLRRFAGAHPMLTKAVIVMTALSILACPIALGWVWLRQRRSIPVVATFLGLVLTDLAAASSVASRFATGPSSPTASCRSSRTHSIPRFHPA